MLRPKRVELVERLKKTAGVKTYGETPGYFSREQIMEITALLEELKTKANHGKVNTDA